MLTRSLPWTVPQSSWLLGISASGTGSTPRTSFSKVRWATEEDRTFDICTDGFEPYTRAIDIGLSDRANYSKVVKSYSKLEEGRERHSPGDFVSIERAVVFGDPDIG